MTAFRWPEAWHDIALAKEVVCFLPTKQVDWDEIAAKLSEAFSAAKGKLVELKGRGCRERMDRLLQKFKAEEAKSLKRSGTKEEYTELCQLLEDIASYVKDCEELKKENGKMRKKKEAKDKQKGEEMRKAAMEGLAKRKRQQELHSASPVSPLEISSAEDVGMDEEELDESKKGLKRRRASTLTAIEFMEKKFLKKAELKEKELVLRRVELELQQKKFEAEEERKQWLQLEMEERRAIIEMLNRR